MEDILTKYNTLSPDIQKEVNDFMEFLLSKQKGKKTFDIKSWKNKIKNISVWTDDDIKVIENGKQQFNQIRPEEW